MRNDTSQLFETPSFFFSSAVKQKHFGAADGITAKKSVFFIKQILCMGCHGYRPGMWLPGAAAHGRPWPPAESVQREGVPRASPA